MKRKLVSTVITIFLFVVINFCVWFTVNYSLEKEAVSYPEKATLLDILRGPNKSLTVKDFELWNWADTRGEGLNATELPGEVWEHKFTKCNRFETIMICILQNRFNSVISIDVVNMELVDIYNQTCGVDFVDLFGNAYTVSMCTNEVDFPDTTLNAGFVVYKADGDFMYLIEEFETPKEYFAKAFPIVLRDVFVTNKYADYVCFVALVIEFVFIYFGVRSLTKKKSGEKNRGDGTMSLSLLIQKLSTLLQLHQTTITHTGDGSLC